MTEERIYEISVNDVKDAARGGLNVRRTDRDANVKELAESIERHGLLQPILVRGQPGKPPYDLIAGHRRLAAHKLLKKKLIKARFKPAGYGDFEAKVDSLVENLHRVELTEFRII
ncbi:MAG: ParB/RepB/Spo0J family partition protein [Phycisphaerae bacterium]|nr:ParB/RepB/Spo0J family partition protein [Phycisphaerae bacterium]